MKSKFPKEKRVPKSNSSPKILKTDKSSRFLNKLKSPTHHRSKQLEEQRTRPKSICESCLLRGRSKSSDRTLTKKKQKKSLSQERLFKMVKPFSIQQSLETESKTAMQKPKQTIQTSVAQRQKPKKRKKKSKQKRPGSENVQLEQSVATIQNFFRTVKAKRKFDLARPRQGVCRLQLQNLLPVPENTPVTPQAQPQQLIPQELIQKILGERQLSIQRRVEATLAQIGRMESSEQISELQASKQRINLRKWQSRARLEYQQLKSTLERGIGALKELSRNLPEDDIATCSQPEFRGLTEGQTRHETTPERKVPKVTEPASLQMSSRKHSTQLCRQFDTSQQFCVQYIRLLCEFLGEYIDKQTWEEQQGKFDLDGEECLRLIQVKVTDSKGTSPAFTYLHHSPKPIFESTLVQKFHQCITDWQQCEDRHSEHIREVFLYTLFSAFNQVCYQAMLRPPCLPWLPSYSSPSPELKQLISDAEAKLTSLLRQEPLTLEQGEAVANQRENRVHSKQLSPWGEFQFQQSEVAIQLEQSIFEVLLGQVLQQISE